MDTLTIYAARALPRPSLPEEITLLISKLKISFKPPFRRGFVPRARNTAAAPDWREAALADVVRKVTGFAIGGVAPLGHLNALPLWMDPHLMDFDQVWAAAGTPHHIFAVAPEVLQRLTKAVVAPFTQAH